MASIYVKQPAAIYRQSFETIKREADFSCLRNSDEVAVAMRVIHACGMVDIVKDLVFSGDVAGETRNAIANGRNILVDANMVKVALKQPTYNLNNIKIRCTLNDPETDMRAVKLDTTRSAAAVYGWIKHIAGSVVVIGNAPTALFTLLELLDKGVQKPAAVFAFPVGFVGAAESKADLIENPRVTFI